MPIIEKRPIRRLNEERLVYGILPTPWMLGYLGFVIIVVVAFGLPGTIVEGIPIVGGLVGGVLLLVAIHRVSRAKIIPHWVKWNLAKHGAIVGRDTNPLPHRYEEVDETTEAYILAKHEEDKKKTAEWKKKRRQLMQERQQKLRREQQEIARASKAVQKRGHGIRRSQAKP